MPVDLIATKTDYYERSAIMQSRSQRQMERYSPSGWYAPFQGGVAQLPPPPQQFYSQAPQDYPYPRQQMPSQIQIPPQEMYYQTDYRIREDARQSADVPRTVDISGEGSQLTIKGHIDLLRYLPVHHDMHRKLLKTFRKKPGDYEGKYNNDDKNKAVVTNLGNGYLSIQLTDDLSQPEMSEFLVAKGWIPLAVTKEGSTTHEKWTNCVTASTLQSAHRYQKQAGPSHDPRMPERYY